MFEVPHLPLNSPNYAIEDGKASVNPLENPINFFPIEFERYYTFVHPFSVNLDRLKMTEKEGYKAYQNSFSENPPPSEPSNWKLYHYQQLKTEVLPEEDRHLSVFQFLEKQQIRFITWIKGRNKKTESHKTKLWLESYPHIAGPCEGGYLPIGDRLQACQNIQFVLLPAYIEDGKWESGSR